MLDQVQFFSVFRLNFDIAGELEPPNFYQVIEPGESTSKQKIRTIGPRMSALEGQKVKKWGVDAVQAFKNCDTQNEF